jgi:hypothetical protein
MRMHEARHDQQAARERERQNRALERERRALEHQRIAERKAADAPSWESERFHRAEAALHERAARLHRQAVELQRRHERESVKLQQRAGRGVAPGPSPEHEKANSQAEPERADNHSNPAVAVRPELLGEERD